MRALIGLAAVLLMGCSTSTSTDAGPDGDGCNHPSGAEICRAMGGKCGPLAFMSGQPGSCPAGTKEYSGGLNYTCWEACVTEGDRILCCIPNPDASAGDAATDSNANDG